MTATGSIGASLYWKYMRAGAGVFLLPVVIGMFFLSQFLFTATDWWLSEWTDRRKYDALMSHLNLTSEEAQDLKAPGHDFARKLSEGQLEAVYAVLVAAGFVACIIRTACFFIMCLRSSIRLHGRLFSSIMRARCQFFDTNPIGALLNRISRDMGIIDDLLPATALDAVEIALNSTATVILTIYVNYYIAIPSLILLGLFIGVRRYYIGAGRGLKRLEGLCRSPVFTHMSLTGKQICCKWRH